MKRAVVVLVGGQDSPLLFAGASAAQSMTAYCVMLDYGRYRVDFRMSLSC